MSLFRAMMNLNELQINGQTVDDNDDFNVGEDEDTTPTENQNDNPSDVAQTDAEDNTTGQSDEGEDDFTLDDADEDNDTQTTEEPANDTGNDENTSEAEDGVDTQNDDGTAGDDSDDDFTVDGGEDKGTDDDNTQSDTSSDSSNTDNAPEDPSENIQDDEDRAAEEAIYDSLTDDQKRIRVLQLKLNYKDLYETMNTTLAGIDNISKNTDNIETIKRLTMLLTKAKSILIDYVENNFDSNPYLENYTMYIKYMAVFRTAAKVIEELNASMEK